MAEVAAAVALKRYARQAGGLQIVAYSYAKAVLAGVKVPIAHDAFELHSRVLIQQLRSSRFMYWIIEA
ncbi:uncharacterized protein CCR75_007736 [Bremia lactucae]|uniref:Uncharacterized protein n=1 Tax=Bremia lactucae TaxID=4779 RepID=A0A976NYN5_BRELC|nr:hypothetical protein CCR75_007736 [Bremia lactucae]